MGPPPALPPLRRSRMAVWAFVLSLTPAAAFALGVLAQLSTGGVDEGFGSGTPPAIAVLEGVLSLLSLAGPIAGIGMGVAVRRDPTADQGSRTLALAAIVIGATILGLYVLSLVLFVLVVLACASACASCGSANAVAAAPCATLATRPGARRPPMGWRQALAHHPDHPALDADVYRVGGLRLCVGCFTAGPALAAAFAAAWLWPVPSAAWALGLALAPLQGLSALGWTTTRARKVLVKLGFGAGSGFLLAALYAAPWPELAKSAALAVGGLLVLASAQPRLRRMERLMAEPAAPA
jgi:hypothetical protein